MFGNDTKRNYTFMGLMATAAMVAMVTVNPLPALAGMGTGNPPPPPPPPRDLDYTFTEASGDINLGGKGYPGIAISHNRSSWDGRTSCTTTANGRFQYRIREGDRIAHRGMMFGLISSYGTANILVATDSVITVKVGASEPDYDSAISQVTKWKCDYVYDRGVVQPYATDNFAHNTSTREFSLRFMPRNTNAVATQNTAANIPKATFILKKLEAYNASGALILAWLPITTGEDIDRVSTLPGKNKTLTVTRIKAVTQK